MYAHSAARSIDAGAIRMSPRERDERVLIPHYVDLYLFSMFVVIMVRSSCAAAAHRLAAADLCLVVLRSSRACAPAPSLSEQRCVL